MGRRARTYTCLLTKAQIEYILELLEDDLEYTELTESEIAQAHGLERRLTDSLAGKTYRST